MISRQLAYGDRRVVVLNPGRREGRFKGKRQLCPSIWYINYGKDSGKRRKGQYGSEGRLGENMENRGTYIQKVIDHRGV